MRWLTRDLWKAGIAIAGILLLLVLTVWIPVSAAGAYEGASGLAGSGTGTVQATPTEDATVTALNKEKLAQEIDQLKNQNHWAWTTIGPILVGLAGLLAALYSFMTWIRNRQDEQKKQREDRNLEREKRDEEQKRWLEDRKAERERRDEEQQRWLKDQEAEREKRAEERFQSIVEGLGSDREEAKIGSAITLRTFLRPGYEQFYRQVFDLAVAHLRLPRNAHGSEDPDPHLPPTTLSQALIMIFKEAFPLARSLNEGSPQSLDATGIQLDNAYLSEADLEQAWMPQASLRKADLSEVHLSRANLNDADLSEASLSEAKLTKATLFEAKLRETSLWDADLSQAWLSFADLTRANLTRADLRSASSRDAKLCEADLTWADLTGGNLECAFSLRDTNLCQVKGLTKEQLEACKAKGAIIDEDTTTSSSQSTVIPPPPSQDGDTQVQSALSAQGSIPTPDTGDSSATSSQQGLES